MMNVLFWVLLLIQLRLVYYMNAKQGYTMIAYPRSIPLDFVEKLDVLEFGYCYSLHDKDTFDCDCEINGKQHYKGELKDAHFHFYFQGNPTKAQKKLISEALGVRMEGQDVRSISGIYDYLTHENDSFKYHYSRNDIVYSSKWCQEFLDSSYVPKHNYRNDIISIIDSHNVTEYCDLWDYVLQFNDEALETECSKYWVMRYIDSKRNKLSDYQKSKQAFDDAFVTSLYAEAQKKASVLNSVQVLDAQQLVLPFIN